jgi:hypothetical protein
MNNKKETVFCIMFGFEYLERVLTQKKFLVRKISQSFEKFYLINSTKLEIGKESFSSNIDSLRKKIPSNCEIIDPNGSEEFINFSKDKNLIIYCNIGRLWRFFRIHYLLKKINAKLIYIHEIGMLNSAITASKKAYLVRIFYHEFPHKVVILLSILKVFPKIDLRFLSNKEHYKKAMDNFLYKISKKFKYINLFYTKNYELINSIAYDQFKSNEIKVSEEKIVVVDTNINHHDGLKQGGGVNHETYDGCYKDLEIYLKMLSSKFKKPVVVCVHPTVDINRIKNLLRYFEVVKHQTRENIYKSFIILFYNSAAIVDAFLLKKRIITIENKRMGDDWVKAVNLYPHKTGLLKIDLQKENKIINNDLFLKKLDDIVKSDKYINFINGQLRSDTSGMMGSDKIISIIRRKYFNS